MLRSTTPNPLHANSSLENTTGSYCVERQFFHDGPYVWTLLVGSLVLGFISSSLYGKFASVFIISDAASATVEPPSLLLFTSNAASAFAKLRIPSKFLIFICGLILPCKFWCSQLSCFSSSYCCWNRNGYSFCSFLPSIPERYPIVQYSTRVLGLLSSWEGDASRRSGSTFRLNSSKVMAPEIMDTLRSGWVRTSTSRAFSPSMLQRIVSVWVLCLILLRCSNSGCCCIIWCRWIVIRSMMKFDHLCHYI